MSVATFSIYSRICNINADEKKYWISYDAVNKQYCVRHARGFIYDIGPIAIVIIYRTRTYNRLKTCTIAFRSNDCG